MMKKILTFGVFDYFHLGHLRLFKQCKNQADYLIVAVQKEEYVLKFKPNCKLLYSTEERVEMLESLKCVDKVVIYDTVCPDFLEKVDFDVLALGEDHKGNRFDIVEEWCNNHCKSVIRLKRTSGISSTLIRSSIENDYT